MVSRFGSGSAGVKQVDASRVNRGAPIRRPQPQPQAQQEDNRSSQEISSRIESLKNRIQELENLKAQNRFNGTGAIISRARARELQIESTGVSAELQYLVNVQSSLEPGQQFSSAEEVKSNAQAVRQEAEQQQKDKIAEGITARRERELSYEKRTKEGYTETADGGFKSYGVTFSKEGTITAIEPTSPVNITPSQVLYSNEAFKQGQNKVVVTKDNAYYAPIDSLDIKPGVQPERAPQIKPEPTPSLFAQFTTPHKALTFKEIAQLGEKGSTYILRNPTFLFSIGAEYTLRAGEYLGNKFNTAMKKLDFKIYPLSNIKAGFAKTTPITRQSAKEFLTFTYTSFGFSPLMKTGTAQITESEYTETVNEYGQRVFIKKSELQKVSITRAQATETFKTLPLSEQAKIIKTSFKGRVYLDKASFLKDINLATKFIAESGVKQERTFKILSKVFPQVFVKDKIIAKVSIGGLQAVQQSVKTQMFIEKVPQLKYLPQVMVSTYAGTGTYERTDMQIPRTTSASMSAQVSRTRQDSASRSALTTLSMSRQTSATTQVSRTQQQTRTLQLSVPKTITQQINTPRLEQPTRTINRQTPIRTGKTPISTPQPIKEIGEEKKPPKLFFMLPKASSTKQSKGLFTVFVRRQGKFKPVGRTTNVKQAFSIGRNIVSNTLAATFKVKGKGVTGATPKGFRMKKNIKEGTLYIELPKYRLSTRGEVKEIQRSKRKR